MQNNNNFDKKISSSNVSPVYALLGGIAMIILNYFLYLSGSVYFMLIIATPMLLLIGVIGLISPNKGRSYNMQTLISIIGLVIGVMIFYSLIR